uniref:NADH dehydrogenase [ubiquinone] 1 beta subcomplex subunit 1 n=1 Tax=Pristiophorus japonicus TaxID=55135 RepID=UPI00398EA6E4
MVRWVSPLPFAPVAEEEAAARAEWETCASIMNLVSIIREHWTNILVPLGFVLGCYLDRRNDGKLTAFRNKSILYRRELKPGEETTWK